MSVGTFDHAGHARSGLVSVIIKRCMRSSRAGSMTSNFGGSLDGLRKTDPSQGNTHGTVLGRCETGETYASSLSRL